MKQACPMTPEQEKWVDAHYQPNDTSIPAKQQEECIYSGWPIPARQCNCPNLAQSLKYVGYAPGMVSFPLGGQCTLGAQVGDSGCTWREAPQSLSLSTGRLIEKGAFDPEKTPSERMTASRAAYEEIGAHPCGSDQPASHVSASTMFVV